MLCSIVSEIPEAAEWGEAQFALTTTEILRINQRSKLGENHFVVQVREVWLQPTADPFSI